MAKKTFAELLAQANIFRTTKGKFAITVAIFFQFIIDIIDKLKELSDRQAADLLGSWDLSGTPAVYPAAERGWWKIETNVASVDGGDLDGLEIKAGGQLVCDGTNFTYVEDPDLANIEAEIDETRGPGWTDDYSNMEIVGKTSVPPEYLAPAFNDFGMNKTIVERGESFTLSLAATGANYYKQNNAGATDWSEGGAGVTFEVDGVVLDKASEDYEGAGLVDTLTTFKKSTEGTIPVKITIAYAQGPVLNELIYGLPYPTGQIPAGTIAKTKNITVALYALFGADLALPGAGTIRDYSKTSANSFTLTIGANDTCAFAFIPAGKSIVSIIDTTNLNAPQNYVLQAMNTAPDADNVNFGGAYYALFFAPYGKTVKHVFTLANS